MKKQWMAAALSAGLCHVAMADVAVTFQGTLIRGDKVVDCPSSATACEEIPVPVDTTPYTLTFTFREGQSPGIAPSSTSVRTVVDPTTGLSYEDLRFNQNHAFWRTVDPSVAQVPTIPSATTNPLAGATDASFMATTTAIRTRLLTHWISDWNGHSVVTTSLDSWTLGSTLTWQSADGSAFQSRVSLNGSLPFATDRTNFDDLMSGADFRNLLSAWTDCASCVRLQLADVYVGSDERSSGVSFFGVGRLVSITEITTAVPEPSTYALMLAGVAAIGFAARRRRAG